MFQVAVANGTTSADPVVFVGTPTFQTRALLLSGNPEQLVSGCVIRDMCWSNLSVTL